LIAPLVCVSALILKTVRRIGVHRLPASRSVLLKIGVFPIRNHFYEPQFDYRKIMKPFSQDRYLPGIDWNVEEQLEMMTALTFAGELSDLPTQKPESVGFYFGNFFFESGDAEFWYQLIRLKQPRKIIEIGSGYSTLIATLALRKNNELNERYACRHICIEPYKNDWLRQTNARVIRKRVEDIGIAFFKELEENDILFIDSSHVIRPQGDVLYEYLEILPSLGKGVIVHVHDVFSPKNYLSQWLSSEIRFYNEQYILEAFLSNNSAWKIIGSLNYLHHNYYANLKRVAPFLTPEREPGSFYMQRTT
jgi:hypothetical protein